MGRTESGTLAGPYGFLEHQPHVVLQGREAPFDNAPDNLEVNAEVFVDEDVSECRDAPPGNLRMSSPKIDRQISDCFADDLQVPDDRILDHGVRKERASAGGGADLDSGDGVLNVLEKDGGVFHSGRASAKMRSRR